jgi:hypothetical protein
MVRTKPRRNGEKFFTLENSKKVATPLLPAIALVGLTDVIFAVDSTPRAGLHRHEDAAHRRDQDPAADLARCGRLDPRHHDDLELESCTEDRARAMRERTQ